MLDPERQGDSTIAASHPWRLLALLIAVTAVSPLALNILAPAMPRLVSTFGAETGTVQLTLSLYLLGMAVSQLVLGALSDRFGRRPVMLAGFVLTVIASFAALAVTSIGGLIATRILQAFGATTGVVIGRAVIRDLYDRDRAASMIGWVTMAMLVAPMIAPLIGGALDTAFGWQAIFIAIGLSAAAALAWTALLLPETRAVATGESPTRFLSEAAALLGSRPFIGYTLVAALNSAVFFTFLGGAPHVMVTIMHRSSAEFGIWFVIISVFYMAGNFCTGRWSARFGVDNMIRIGLAITVTGAATGVAWVLLNPHGGPEVIFVPQMVTSFASGLLLPNAVAGAVSVRPHAAGASAGITGFAQMGLGAATAQLVGNLLEGATTPLPLTAITFVVCVSAVVSFFGLVRR
jgi:DHA1 family bicyclomycin/chloramphenicol resistance-like MFS transporter